MKAYWKDAGMQRLYKLLEEVGGYMLFIDNHPILSTYGAMNNGMTNNIVDVWGGSGKDGYGTPYTYLAGGIDCIQWDGKAKGYASQIILPSSVVKAQLESYFGFTLGSDPSKWLVITKTNAFGYVMSVSVDGKAAIAGKDLRGSVFTSSRVGVKNCLRSTSFTVQYDAASVTFYFDVKGYGHGVGMSQEGAQQMALAGYKWQDILKFYFPGVSIV
jgi:stage II sporulation protein D